MKVKRGSRIMRKKCVHEDKERLNDYERKKCVHAGKERFKDYYSLTNTDV